MIYPEYDNVKGKDGGPYYEEKVVLAREKQSAANENREPDYIAALDDLYDGDLPTPRERQPEVKDESGVVLNPEVTVWEERDSDSIDYNTRRPNDPVRQTAKNLEIQQKLLEKNGTLEGDFGNVGNQELIGGDNAGETPENSEDGFPDVTPEDSTAKKTAAKKTAASSKDK